MSTKSLSSNEENPELSPICNTERVSFKYAWTTKILMRQLNDNESVILHVSPKFATVHQQIAFQWSLKMRGTTFLNDREQAEETEVSEDEAECEPNYIALSLYFNDGPAPVIDDLQTVTKLLQDKKISTESNDNYIVAETRKLSVIRGKETELTTVQRFYFSDYIKENVGQVIRLEITLNFLLKLFDPTTYLNTLTPTPITSFLTANYRARASSKVFRRPRKNKLLAEMEDSLRRRLSLKQQVDFEEIFNRIMDDKKEPCDKLDPIVDLKKCEGRKDGSA
uniref:Uncharacterized protein n=2 Tax=Onchocerca ochengi TaxID=42157 RepID=A0A182EH83_ONCOC